MAFIDEVNAVDLKGMRKGKVPLAVAAVAGVVALVAAIAIATALSSPAVTIQPTDQETAVEEAESENAGEGDSGAAASSSLPEGGSATSGEAGAAAEALQAEVAVHVGGCVAVPGLYRMPAGSRVDDAVKAAGGSTGEAALDAVNLAAPLEDGMQVIIPSLQQVAEGTLPAGSSGSSQGTSGTAGSAASGPININAATADQLTALSGIGDALAKRIVDDREKNGPFSSIDDLTRVSGIGEKKLEGFRDEVCV